MKKYETVRYFLFFVLCNCLVGCTGQVHTIDLRHIRNPVQMGPLHIMSADSSTTHIHALQTVSGNYKHELEEETITCDENDTYGGWEYRKETLYGSIGEALFGTNRFIADVKVTAKVETGISIGAGCTFFMGMISDGATKLGGIGREEFHFSGRAYEKRVK